MTSFLLHGSTKKKKKVVKLSWNSRSLENLCVSYICVSSRKHLPCSSQITFTLNPNRFLTAQLVLELLCRQMFSKSRCLVQEASTSWRTIFILLMGRNLSCVLWTIETNWWPFIAPWCGKFTPEVNLVFLLVFLLLVDARQLICVCYQNVKMSRKYLLLF